MLLLANMGNGKFKQKKRGQKKLSKNRIKSINQNEWTLEPVIKIKSNPKFDIFYSSRIKKKITNKTKEKNHINNFKRIIRVIRINVK